jgi:prevent-host-death family protein
MSEVSVRELKNNLSRYLREVEAGHEVTVTRRGKRVATLTPAEKKAPKGRGMEGIWKMVREGKMTWSGEKFVPPKKRVKLRGKGPTATEMLLEDRHSERDW